MRQRKIKNLDEKITALNEFIIEDSKEKKGCWASVFGNENPIYLELGCGKGKFLLSQAINNPDKNFIGIEGQESVVLRALEKAKKFSCKNIKFVIGYVEDISEYFQAGEIDGMFLNFSDPWPKARHEKRRLTYGERLLQYREIVKSPGSIEIKTDNENLFQFTLEQIELKNLEIIEMSRDLHNSQIKAKQITTEYEDRFVALGKNINYVSVRA